jgi:hypothetical protein
LHCRMKSEIWICELALWSVAGFRFRWWWTGGTFIGRISNFRCLWGLFSNLVSNFTSSFKQGGAFLHGKLLYGTRYRYAGAVLHCTERVQVHTLKL